MRICLLHDLFRTRQFGQGGQNRTAAMWAQVLGPVIAGLGHTLYRPGAFIEDEVPVLEALGLPPVTASWVRFYSHPEALPLVAEILDEHVLARPGGPDLVLGWELSPNMLRVLAARRVPTIEFNLDAVRFAPDLFLRARANRQGYRLRLAAHAVPDAPLRAHAARFAASLPAAPALPPATLFAGQVADDSSLIEGAALAGVSELLPAFPPGPPLLLKPHPHGAPHPDIAALHGRFGNARVTTDNIYALLAAPHVKRVVAMSSSVLAEAALFGKPVTALITPDQHPDRLAEYGGYARLDARFLTAGFWRALLEGGPAAGAGGALSISGLFNRSWGRVAGLPQIERHALGAGTRYRFGAGQNGVGLLGLGWTRTGPDRSRTEAGLATIHLTPEAAPRGMRVHLHCHSASPTRLAVAARSPRLGGERGLASATLEAGFAQVVSLVLPPGLCGAPLELVLRPDQPMALLGLVGQ